MRNLKYRLGVLGLLAVMVGVSAWQAKAGDSTAKLFVRVRPLESEIFIDAQHMGDASWGGTLTVHQISPGEHTVGIYNYGFVPQTFKVNFQAGQTSGLDVLLQPVPGMVSGPWGRIEVKGAPRAAILLNGKTPEFVVGHAGETDSSFIWQQELLVPPGTHQVAVVHGDKTIWSGPVTVEAGKRTVVNVKSGATHEEDWKGAEPNGELPRFESGVHSTRIAVEPAKGSITASPAEINCGDSSQLSWSSSGAMHAELMGAGDVAPVGSESVSPQATTEYKFTAAGPGGVATSMAKVMVNKAINATLNVSPETITYEKVGNEVTSQGTATVSWSATGGGPVSVTLDPLGSVDASGSRQIQLAPQQTAPGPVNETVTYALHATNKCGGDETRTAVLRLTGEIKPEPVVAAVVEKPFAIPPYSSEFRIPDKLLITKSSDTLGLAYSRIQLALKRGGFQRYSVYPYTDHGFAVITAPEHIKSDGKHVAGRGRWTLGSTKMKGWTFEDVLHRLNDAGVGRYRFMILAVTQDETVPDPAANPEDVKSWAETGSSNLSRSLAVQKIKRGATHCDALIYEFYRPDKEHKNGEFIGPEETKIKPQKHIADASLWTQKQLTK